MFRTRESQNISDNVARVLYADPGLCLAVTTQVLRQPLGRTFAAIILRAHDGLSIRGRPRRSIEADCISGTAPGALTWQTMIMGLLSQVYNRLYSCSPESRRTHAGKGADGRFPRGRGPG